MTEPFHVPDVIVPNVVIFPVTAVGKVELMLGTPPADVMRTPLFAVARPVIALDAEL
jgi:hypothetical protein